MKPVCYLCLEEVDIEDAVIFIGSEPIVFCSQQHCEIWKDTMEGRVTALNIELRVALRRAFDDLKKRIKARLTN